MNVLIIINQECAGTISIMVDTSLLHVDNVNKDNEKCLYNSIIPTNNNKINCDDIVVVVTPNNRNEDDFFFKKSLWMKVMIINSAVVVVVVVLIFVATYYSTPTAFLLLDNNNNRNSNNDPSSITAPDAFVGSRRVDGCNIASDTYVDAGGRTVDTENPFELCFQLGNTDTFCWSKSHSHVGTFLFTWVGCYPCGYNIDSLYQFDDYWHGTSGRGDNNCGPTCTEFCHPKDINECSGVSTAYGEAVGDVVVAVPPPC